MVTYGPLVGADADGSWRVKVDDAFVPGLLLDSEEKARRAAQRYIPHGTPLRTVYALEAEAVPPELDDAAPPDWLSVAEE